jgi:hypothetical protein
MLVCHRPTGLSGLVSKFSQFSTQLDIRKYANKVSAVKIQLSESKALYGVGEVSWVILQKGT